MRTLRRLVLGSCALAIAFVTVIASVVTWTWSSADVSTVGTTEFTRPLNIPPLADSSIDADGTRVFSLDMRTGTTEFEAGEATETWGFNGSYLGPTLRANRGEKVRVRVRNELPEASTTCR
ncbi:multicopper oxidase domain-containing protein [Nocardia sp. GTS18]|uniref:multicopper oxidase domain-containing protein n=1 Tax=Nocardia sp. GTS18 TaxID=1778064 RepID=UPI002103D76F|nr:multicopper oxidase domain-containing protein [Nocardia sp. GTS18]